ncbi:MAG: PEP-CTERM sorting domain-containing protein [Planctomycetes bacterium]|nr:PEP-CTERM sorting domain-containing protein [Planctomycetota bacterium]
MSKLFLTVLVVTLVPIASSRAAVISTGLIALPLRDGAGKLQIFAINSDGSNRQQLTFDGENGRPDWSPDGRKITFSSLRNGGAWVAVMDADGSNQHLLAEGVAPDWSPDGKQIAFSRPDGSQIQQIWGINADGSNIRQITHSSTFKIAPSWSPHGNEMVFITPRNPTTPTDPQPEIGIMNSDGTNERILTTEDRVNILVNPDGSTTVLETAYDANAPSWSPVDNRIAFWSGIENQYGQIWTINSDGTGSKQLTEDPNHRNSDDPAWSPDGTKILFSTGRSGRNELWVMDADGSNEERISDIDASPFPGRASWQPVIVPEPATFILGSLGLFGIVGLSARHRR